MDAEHMIFGVWRNMKNLRFSTLCLSASILLGSAVGCQSTKLMGGDIPLAGKDLAQKSIEKINKERSLLDVAGYLQEGLSFNFFGPYDSASQVMGSTNGVTQSTPAGAASAFDGYDRTVVVFSEGINGVNGWIDDQVYAQVVDTYGKALGPRVRIGSSAPTRKQLNPAITFNNSTGHFLITWSDNRSGNMDIYGQVVSLSDPRFIEQRRDPLKFVGGNFAICSDAGNQGNSVVAYDSTNKKYLVAWQDNQTSITQIAGQLITGNTDGTVDVPTTPKLDISAATANCTYPSVVYNSNAGARQFVVGYTYANPANSKWHAYTRRVKASLADPLSAGSPVLITENSDLNATYTPNSADVDLQDVSIYNGYNEHNVDRVRLACNPNGNKILAAWTYGEVGTSPQDFEIHARLLDGDGNKMVGSPVHEVRAERLAVDESQQANVSVVYNPSNSQYLVAWQDQRNDSASTGRFDVYGRIIDATGLPGAEFPIATSTGGSHYNPVLSYNSRDSKVYAFWADQANGSIFSYVYAQRLIY